MTPLEWRDELNELWLLGEEREHAADVAAISLRDRGPRMARCPRARVTRHSNRFRLLLKAVRRRGMDRCPRNAAIHGQPETQIFEEKSKSEAASSGTC